MSQQTEIRDGMRIDWDVPITMDDGIVLRADVYRPPQDGKYPGEGIRLATFVNELKGSGPFLHDDPGDRPSAIFGGKNTLYAGGDRAAYVLLPIIPKGDSSASED